MDNRTGNTASDDRPDFEIVDGAARFHVEKYEPAALTAAGEFTPEEVSWAFGENEDGSVVLFVCEPANRACNVIYPALALSEQNVRGLKKAVDTVVARLDAGE
jgi:hypothetical protein